MVNGIPYCNYIACKEPLQNTGVPTQNAEDTLAKCEGGYPQNARDNYNINSKDNYKRVDNNSHPSLEEVRAYCLERNNGINPESFIDYYTANGWKVGRNPMRDWRAAVRQWEQRRKEAPAPQAPRPQQQPKESVYERNARAFAEFERRLQMQYADEQ